MFVLCICGLGRLTTILTVILNSVLATQKHGKTSGDHLFTTLGTGLSLLILLEFVITPLLQGTTIVDNEKVIAKRCCGSKLLLK